MPTNYISEFTKLLVGGYSNKEQSFKNPRLFAHINMFFIPLDFYIFKQPIIYSEQSYDYSPWSPYRQSLHKIKSEEGLIIVENYIVENRIRAAGAGFRPELLQSLAGTKLIKKTGCSMHFRKIKDDYFQGELEPGCNCRTLHSGKESYVSTKVQINKDSCIVLDEGFECKTKKKVWGSNHGPIKFKKTLSLDHKITIDWM
tara:strand:- start:6 stop:605 length:600 start_codon:yes stop_codon:yes gene_type:complete